MRFGFNQIIYSSHPIVTARIQTPITAGTKSRTSRRTRLDLAEIVALSQGHQYVQDAFVAQKLRERTCPSNF